jgi:thiamine monophosphate kinase
MALGEFDLIARHFTRPVRRSPLGVGDDCALIAPAAGMQLAVSSDMLVEGRHFLSTVLPRRLGHKALAVNLSDLAACGAEPLAFTLALALPRADEIFLQGLAEGLWALAERHGIELVGGDMRHQSGDPDRLRGIACAGKPDIGLERTQCSEPSFVARIAFVGDVVGMAGETVDCNDRRAQSSRHQPGRYREVFVVFDTVQGGGHAGL